MIGLIPPHQREANIHFPRRTTFSCKCLAQIDPNSRTLVALTTKNVYKLPRQLSRTDISRLPLAILDAISHFLLDDPTAKNDCKCCQH
ncbi:unnamed protein product [Protopolystoma xenopodis]|uniref:Uncharacterized protein n=1 Tax=Protopolystoma xenopodis TaxID=117903 RepID=A0A3S5ART3_9PLAT|nr:unnamed protein product [Protopolystoma xenopodis]